MVLGRRRFRVWIGVGALLLSLGVASLVSAYVRDQAPNVAYFETEEGGTIIDGCTMFGCIDRFDPTPWFAGGGVLVAAAAVPFLLAARRR
jgi:hypothetical protein